MRSAARRTSSRLLAAWLALLPVQPSVAAMVPPADSAAFCDSHGCRCPRPGTARRTTAVRSCHESKAGYIGPACRHDPQVSAHAGSPPYLPAIPVVLAALVPRPSITVPPARPLPDTFPGVDPPPPRSPAA